MIIRILATLIVLMSSTVSVNANNLIPQDSEFLTLNNNSHEILAANNSNINQDILNFKDGAKKEIITKRENMRLGVIALLCIISVLSLRIVITAIQKMNGSASDVVSASGLNFIVFGTIILVTVSDTEQQLTAAIGVIGAIAGYLFSTLKEKVGHIEGSSLSSNKESKKEDGANILAPNLESTEIIKAES